MRRMKVIAASLLCAAMSWPVVAQEAEVAARLVLTETPTADAQGNVYFIFGYFFEGIPRKILKLSPDGMVSVFRDNVRASSLLFDPQGRFVILGADVKGRRGVTREDLRTGAVEILADGYQGAPFKGPNDITIDGKGRLYFTDRPGRAVYRIDGPGKVARVLSEADLQEPNGLGIAPDDKTLYVVETSQAKGGARRINAYDLSPEGTASHMRVLYNFYPGRSADGMSVDTQGNVYASGGINLISTLRVRPNREVSDETMDTKGGVYVISPQGKLIKFIPIPEDTITNCTFGGPDMRTLYVTAGKTIFKVRTDIPGLPR